ncbi:MAG: ASPIC/UnbV domain-containing protein, partial [Planctomycetes bacterium]|nr:ASPIC/UnbV domain-containing protein [Planctomycetota bacterium]
AFGDYDDDGDLDILVLCLDQPSRLLRNDGGNRNHWIQILLRGTRSNPDAFGSRVTVRAGDLLQTTERKNAASYLSQNDPRLHFGLGGRTKVDQITVRWPSGAVQTLKDIPADQVLRIEEPDAKK